MADHQALEEETAINLNSLRKGFLYYHKLLTNK